MSSAYLREYGRGRIILRRDADTSAASEIIVRTSTIFACGNWSVMASDDGWSGRSPNSDEERSPAAALSQNRT